MASRRLHQDDDATTCKPDWTANPCMNYAQSRHCDGQRPVGTTGASTRKRKIAEVLGQESAEHARTAHGKRARICQEEDVFGVALDKRHVGRPGHSYRQVYSDGNARVHVGDSYAGTTINHNYFGLCAAMNMRLDQDIEPSEEAAILRLAAVIIVAAIANAIVQPFLLLQNALHRAIPHAAQRRVTPLSSLFGSRMVLFEDALGRFERIDINVVTDWTSFHYNLTRAFADQPGHRRVAVAGYRLSDQKQGAQLIDPRRPPPFASVFMRNKHVRMSIHFAWDEVSLECCPKCGLKQICELDKETTCKAKACGFSYRGNIKEPPIIELEDDDDGGVSQDDRSKWEATRGQRADPRRRLMRNEHENPAWFSRISVSQQPEAIGLRHDSKAEVNDLDILAREPDTHSADNNVNRPNLTPLSEEMQDTQSLKTRNQAKKPLIDFFDDKSWAQGNISYPYVWSGESQTAPVRLRAGAKRRAQSPITLERATNNEHHNSPVWDPSGIFEQWNAAFGTQLKPNPEATERIRKAHQSSNASRTTVRLGNPMLSINEGEWHQDNSPSHRVAPATRYDNQIKSSTYVTPAMWQEAYLNSGYKANGGAGDYRSLTEQHTLSTVSARSERDLKEADRYHEEPQPSANAVPIPENMNKQLVSANNRQDGVPKQNEVFTDDAAYKWQEFYTSDHPPGRYRPNRV